MAVSGTRIIKQMVEEASVTRAPADTHITVLSDGGWVLTWQVYGLDDSYEVFQQRYDATGTAQGAVVQVNTHAAGHQLGTDVAALSDGGWIVTWTSTMQDGDRSGVYQQRYDRNGVAVGAETRVNTTTDGDQGGQRVTALAGGGWVVTWRSPGDGWGLGIYQQRYDENGVAVGAEARVNTTIDNEQVNPHLTSLEDGGWVVSWISQAAGKEGIFQQRYRADGSREGTETMIYHTGAQLSMTALDDGGWVVAWARPVGSNVDIYQQRYDSTGAKVGTFSVVNTTARENTSPSVTALDDGGWLVVWRNDSQDKIYLQRYDILGNKRGGEEFVTDSPRNYPGVEVKALPGGGWIVVSQDRELYQQRYLPTMEARLTTHTERLTGDGADDVFDVEHDGLGAGDEIDGGAGLDTLRMLESGTLDLTKPVTLTGVEDVLGTNDDDIVIANAARIAGFVHLDGGDGTDELVLENGTYDLTNTEIINFEKIILADGGDVAFANKDAALLVHGKAGETTQVSLEGSHFTEAEKLQLFRKGVTTIEDDGGVYTNAAPEEMHLSSFAAMESAAQGALVGSLSAEDPNAEDIFTYTLIDDAGGRFAVTGNMLVVANGILVDYEQATGHVVRIRVTDNEGLSFEKSFTIGVTDVDSERVSGTAGDDVLWGGGKADMFHGLGGNDVLKGNAGKDTLNGGIGADNMSGGLDSDVLTGGAGKDIFVFNAKLGTAKMDRKVNFDKITDFNVKDDAIWLDNAVFKKLGKGTEKKPGKLDKKFFAIGTKAKDANDHLIYNKATGVLSYDADGSGKGQAIEFAQLKKGLALKQSHFFVI